MSWRTVIVSSRSKLELKNGYLVIRSDTVKRVHLDEISVLVIENTGSAVTAALLEALWENKTVVIFCDHKRNPGAQLLPYYNSFDCSARVNTQIQWTQDIKDLVWTEIIKEKIRKQAQVIEKLNLRNSDLLYGYIDEIETGDSTNREGHAAKVYFNSLFGSSFSRSDDCFTNSALNYGYGLLLSFVNREIVANGYLTQLGLFHKNVFNQFNLSSDLMEPFRPLFDLIVYSMPKGTDLEHEDNLFLLNTLNERVQIGKTKQTVINAVGIYVKSILDALDNNDLSLIKFYEYEF